MVYYWILMSLILSASYLHAAKEIEIKCTFDNEGWAHATLWLKENATFKETQQQEEYYLDNPLYPFKPKTADNIIDSINTLRIRKTDKGHWVCAKTRNLDPKTGKTLSRDEHETQVSDPHALLQLFKALGYTDITSIKKTRDIYLFQDVEFAVDNVEGLGKFLEIELKRECCDDHEGLSYLMNILRTMKLSQITTFDRGYIHMIWNPSHNFGEIIDLSQHAHGANAIL